MFLDTPRLRDEPRDEEGRDEGRLNRLHRLHRGLQRCGEAIERIASTGVDQHGEVRAGFEDDGEDDKDNERTTEQRFELRRVTRYDEPASMPRTAKIRQDTPKYTEPAIPSLQYRVDVTKKEKWTSGYDWIHMLCLPPLFYI